MPLEGALPIVNEDGTMTDTFRTYMNTVDRYLPVFGAGSPEGVVAAPLYTPYIDTAATSSPFEYRKLAADVGGDKSMGWEAV